MSDTIPTLGSVKLAVGYDCNMKCGFCLQQRSDRKPVLDFALVEKIFSQAMVKRDVKLITLTGGEPTYGPYRELSLKIIRFLHGMGKEVSIFTNGLLLDDKMVKDFRDAGLDAFRISLYDPIDWVHVKELMARLKAHGLPAMAKYTVTKETYSGLKTILEKLPDSGVEWFQIKPYNRIEILEVDAKYELSPEEVIAMSKMLVTFKKSVQGKIKVDLLPLCYDFVVDASLDVKDLSLCHCGKGERGYVVINPLGEVRICGAYPEPIGNANTETIEHIWSNHPLLKMVRNLGNRPKPKECENCNHWEKCAATDCHSAIFAKYGNFDHGNPQCPLVASSIPKGNKS